jgi:hypothetical protein
MNSPTTFSISHSGHPLVEFSLHERCCYTYEKVNSVRACLNEHLKALELRMEALTAILATDDPERAEQLLLDPLSVAATEVTLRPRPETAAIEALIKHMFPPR